MAIPSLWPTGTFTGSSVSYVGGVKKTVSTPASKAGNTSNSAKTSRLSKKDAMTLSALSVLDTKNGKKPLYDAESARKAAEEGVPTHSFFYQDIDALAQKAAKDPDALDRSFARDTLDFFTGGNYTEQEVDALHTQMTAALQELSRQLEETGSVNAGTLQSRMDIGGSQVSLGELAEYQMMGQKLSPVFNSITKTSSRFDDMQATAKMAVARLAGRTYGQSRGDVGGMFSAAIDRLYEKGMDRVDQLYTDAQSALPQGFAQESSQIRNKLSELFSQSGTGNRSALAHDLNGKLTAMRGMMNQQYAQFGVPVSFRNANAAAQNVGMYFTALYRLL